MHLCLQVGCLVTPGRERPLTRGQLPLLFIQPVLHGRQLLLRRRQRFERVRQLVVEAHAHEVVRLHQASVVDNDNMICDSPLPHNNDR